MKEIKPIFVDFHTFHFFKCTRSIRSTPYLPYNNGLFTFSAIKMAVHYTYSCSALPQVSADDSSEEADYSAVIFSPHVLAEK